VNNNLLKNKIYLLEETILNVHLDQSGIVNSASHMYLTLVFGFLKDILLYYFGKILDNRSFFYLQKKDWKCCIYGNT
jgi:hypothetical protein